jgi:hypothetical protein
MKLGGEQIAIPSNKWFDSDCREAQPQYHMGLYSSHSIGSSRIAFKKYCMTKKHSHLECKQKDYLLLMSDPKLFWKSFEEKDESTLPITPQKAIDTTQKYTPCDKVSMIILSQTLNFQMFLHKGNMGHYERSSKPQGMRYSRIKT